MYMQQGSMINYELTFPLFCVKNSSTLSCVLHYNHLETEGNKKRDGSLKLINKLSTKTGITGSV